MKETIAHESRSRTKTKTQKKLQENGITEAEGNGCDTGTTHQEETKISSGLNWTRTIWIKTKINSQRTRRVQRKEHAIWTSKIWENRSWRIILKERNMQNEQVEYK